MTSIPVIDIAPFLAGSSEGRDKVAAEIRKAGEEIGFFVIRGHGVEQALIDETYAAAAAFFRLPVEDKRTILQPPAPAAASPAPAAATTPAPQPVLPATVSPVR